MENNPKLLGLACLPSFGAVRLRQLLACFQAPDELWAATRAQLHDRKVPDMWIDRFLQERSAVDAAAVDKKCRQHGIAFVWNDEAAFPELLRQMPDGPIGLFVRGTMPGGSLALAIVGTRRPTSYGRQVSREFSSALARNGVTIVSGLALGIDGVAHEAAVAAGGRTVAVLGCGLDGIYPPSHTGLAAQIVAAGGALLSEFPPGTHALKHHFPIRNRIIAGSSSGTLVTEAPEKSGALLTAKLALDYNREVFAVPGPITSAASDGTNRLLRDGAHLVMRAQDVLEHFHLSAASSNRPVTALSDDERTVLECFARGPLTVDQIFQISRLNTSAINAALTLLHMKGWIHPLDALHYVRNR